MALLKAFHPRYGRLGRLSRQEWKAYLASNQGLFRRMAKAPDVYAGPHLDERGKVTGDSGGVEGSYFMLHSTREQQEFHEELQQENLPAAFEYTFTIIGVLERWKKDMRWLKVALHYLQDEEKYLREEAALIKNEAKHFPAVLRRHFPQLFRDIEFPSVSFDEIMARVKHVLKEVEPEEKYLENYLALRQRDMPFLFED